MSTRKLLQAVFAQQSAALLLQSATNKDRHGRAIRKQGNTLVSIFIQGLDLRLHQELLKKGGVHRCRSRLTASGAAGVPQMLFSVCQLPKIFLSSKLSVHLLWVCRRAVHDQ